jgi:hypothetical protein
MDSSSPVPFSPSVVSLTLNARRPILALSELLLLVHAGQLGASDDTLRYHSVYSTIPYAGPKSRRESPARPKAAPGTWRWVGVVGFRVDGNGGRRPAAGKREAVRCGAESVPSAGWREVAEACHAEEGQRHE